jgi:hypothetical protein
MMRRALYPGLIDITFSAVIINAVTLTETKEIQTGAFFHSIRGGENGYQMS